MNTEAEREALHEGGLADADRTFDSNIVGKVRVVCIELQAFLPIMRQRVEQIVQSF